MTGALTDERPVRNRARSAGQALVIVALSIVALLGAAGLAIDGGRMFAERREAQGAADHAATSASYASCSGKGTSQSIAAGRASAATNGYNNNGTTNFVTVTRVTGNLFRAVVRSIVAGTFARVLGFSNLSVSAVAEADCVGGFGPTFGAVFAGGDTCNTSSEYTFKASGSGQRVSGGVHSNGDVAIESKPNWWTDDGVGDPFTYVGDLIKDYTDMQHAFYDPLDNGPAPPRNIFEQSAAGPPGYPEVDTWRDWPGGYAPEDVPAQLAFYRALADASPTDEDYYFVDGNLTSLIVGADGRYDGLYYVTGTVSIGAVTGNPNVTIVSEGSIALSASSVTLSPFMDNLLAFSGLEKTGDKVCSEFTVKVEGSGINWNGVIWAPLGLVEMAGSSNATLEGSVIAWAVKMNGTDLSLNHVVPTPGPPGLVYLYH